jgi:hypothetical protein
MLWAALCSNATEWVRHLEHTSKRRAFGGLMQLIVQSSFG